MIKTRERIKQTAIEMFNEKGLTNVSTVQLSAELKISPGNLYYYFDNKEHLVRDIWSEDIVPNTDMLFIREDLGHSENGIINFFSDYTERIIKYKFYYAEIYAIIMNDKLMAGWHKERYDKLLERLLEAMANWEETGIMESITDKRKKALAESILISNYSGHIYVGMINKNMSKEDFLKKNILYLFSIIAPFLTDNATQRTMVLLKKKGIVDEDYSEGL